MGPFAKFAYRKKGTGNACAGHRSVIDSLSEPECTIILFPETIFGPTLPTGSALAPIHEDSDET